jgi:ATP-dependent DNA helicase RecQ
MALIRQAIVAGLLKKEIEQYGVIHLTKAGKSFLAAPTSFMMTKDHKYNEENDEKIVQAAKNSLGTADKTLFAMLKDLRKKEAAKLGVPPFVIFQDPSLEDMALKYPISMDDLGSIYGVGEGKAKKYGRPFLALIDKYVVDNDIIRPDDFVVKTTGAKSGLKLFVIQSVDRKLSLDDIASSKGLTHDELLKEMEQIVFSGTKLNIQYWIDEMFDEDMQEELHEYFLDAQSDDIAEASAHFDGDYEDEELRLYRISFFSEVAN